MLFGLHGIANVGEYIISYKGWNKNINALLCYIIDY